MPICSFGILDCGTTRANAVIGMVESGTDIFAFIRRRSPFCDQDISCLGSAR